MALPRRREEMNCNMLAFAGVNLEKLLLEDDCR